MYIVLASKPIHYTTSSRGFDLNVKDESSKVFRKY